MQAGKVLVLPIMVKVKKVNKMGFLKNAGKVVDVLAKLAPGGSAMNAPAQAMFGTLAEHLTHEKERHAPHEKVKEIHHHYHKKK